MAVGTADSKQTLHHQPALIALGQALQFLPHHTRPFRRRHILFLLLSILLATAFIVELTVVITRQSLNPKHLFSQAITPAELATISQVRSSNGFSFSFNNSQFKATVQSTALNGQASDAELAKKLPLTSVILTPLPSHVPAPEAAAQFQLTVESDTAAFATFKSGIKTKSDITAITADYFAPKPSNVATISEDGRTTESVGGTLMTKAIYTVTPKFAGNPTKTIVWSAQSAGKPVAITIRGVVSGVATPSSMQPIMKTIQLESEAKVEGISTVFGSSAPPVVQQKYVADLVSPAVVKVYHIVCGTLVYNNQVMSDDTCSGSTGSGFLVSGDGYIATNGHVVVYGAKDILVNNLLSNKNLLAQFLKGTKLSPTQIQEVMNRPDLTASVVSGIYDLSDSQLRLVNQREKTIVALGNTPLEIKDEAELKRLVDKFESTTSLKQATVIGYDYSSKDQLTLVSDPEKGFSASDVALIKVSIHNAPFIPVSKTPVTQNQKITLFGFPGDAENELTDNSKLGVSVTNGSISSIREAAGGKSKLYQSDADASQGNSGGPAIDENGEVFGLLTYRFSSGDTTNAAKSYIRDITDFTKLVKDKNVTLDTTSTTQESWQRGLSLYGQHHYSAALKEFEKISREYPSHRLASTYIDLSKQAIQDGKDVKDPSTLLLIIGIGIGLGGLGMAVVLIARHHGFHKVYRAFHQHGLAHTTSA